jgi:hypothetical protein
MSRNINEMLQHGQVRKGGMRKFPDDENLPSSTLAYWTVSGFPVRWMYLEMAVGL